MEKKTAAVIGAGIGGIAMAIRMACKGYRVEVFEAAPQAGGKLNEIRAKGYRFDAGPSLFTLPELVDELYALCGKPPGSTFRYEKLENICRYHYEDGSRLEAWQDIHAFAGELEQKTSDSAASLNAFLERSRLLYELTAPVFIFRSFHRISTFLSRDFLRALVRIHRLQTLRSMYQVIRKYFRDPKSVQLFSRYATYNGSNPYRAPGTLNVIPHLEHRIGAFFPKGGMYQITDGLVNLAREQGVRFHFNHPVERILLEKGRATGVRSRGKEYPAGLVVSDIDVVKAYALIPGLELPKRYLRHERSTSALIFYWGMRGDLPPLELHNIFFSADYPEEFRHLFETKSIFHDPTVYLFISSVRVPGDAPAGGQNWFVMINVPENVGQDWGALIPEARRNILNKLERNLGMNLEDKIEFEDRLDPVSIESRTSSWRGSLYGISSNNRMSAFSRHPNFSRRVGGLYFVGGSVHPGGGIPLCLASARIVDKLIPVAGTA